MSDADDRHLEQLFEILVEERVSSALAHVRDDPNGRWSEELSQSAARLVDDPAWQLSGEGVPDFSRDVGLAEQFLSEVVDPQSAFRGQIAGELTSLALEYLPEHDSLCSEVTVCVLPTGQLNACVTPLPSGRHAILVDTDVLTMLPDVCRWLWAFASWPTGEPYCKDHSRGEFGIAIVAFANYLVHGNVGALARRPVWDCPSIPDEEPLSDYFATEMTRFMLLHEIGHVLLGHTASGSVTYCGPQGGSRPIPTRRLAWRHEHEADEFAIDVLVDRVAAEYADQVAFGAGMFLGLWQVAEVTAGARGFERGAGHPPASDRWFRVSSLASLDSHLGSPVWLLDGAVRYLADKCSSNMKPSNVERQAGEDARPKNHTAE